MINHLMLDILIRKIKNGEVKIADIKLEEYKAEVERVLSQEKVAQ